MSKRAKGEGTIRQRRDGTWEGRYYDCLGNQKSVYGKTKQEAFRKLKEFQYVQDTDVFDEIRGDIELDIWFRHYIDIKKRMVKPQSLLQIEMAYKKHISPILGKKIICKIRPNDINRLEDSLQCASLNATSVINVLRHARAMFNFAVSEGVITKSPFIYVKTESPPKSGRRAFTNTEIKHMFDIAKSMDYEFYIMLNTLLYTGIRVGELCAIRWDDFTDDFTELRIDESLSFKNGDHSLKTKGSLRTIPLADILKSEYEQMYEHKVPKESSDYVYINRLNRPFSTGSLAVRFQNLKEFVHEAFPEDNLNGLTLHCFRHTFITNGLHSGISVPDMQALSGHAKSSTLLDVYAHSDQRQKKLSVDAIAERLQDIEEIADSETPQNQEKWRKHPFKKISPKMR